MIQVVHGKLVAESYEVDGGWYVRLRFRTDEMAGSVARHRPVCFVTGIRDPATAARVLDALVREFRLPDAEAE